MILCYKTTINNVKEALEIMAWHIFEKSKSCIIRCSALTRFASGSHVSPSGPYPFQRTKNSLVLSCKLIHIKASVLVWGKGGYSRSWKELHE